VPRVYAGEHAYLLQQPDGRVVFALPYGEHNLIGTTDVAVDSPEVPTISEEEIAYLCAASNRSFTRQTSPPEVIWSYSGIRALHDDGAAEARAVTRDYKLVLDPTPGPKLLSVFGGKLTTARALAEEAVGKLNLGGQCRTRETYLPGGERGGGDEEMLGHVASWIEPDLLTRLARNYGARIADLLGTAASMADLGRHFGAGLYQAEVDYLRRVEWAHSADDILWRRTKLGLKFSPAETQALTAYLGG
jgi:glycerol-3-phosphate dehydrogenase